MKTLSKQFFLIALTIIVNSLFGQDIFYTISGEIDSQKVGLDSIVIVNTQNGTKLLFEDLSVQEDYVINLSTQTLWGSTGLSDLQFEIGFNILKNITGELSIAVDFTPTEPLNISIYNVQGQRIYSALPMNITAGNSIDVQLANMGIYFVKVESGTGSKTFKALGSDNINEFSVALDYEKSLNSKNLKSSLNTYDSDFSFEIGDYLRVSVYKASYWSSSKTLAVTSSLSLVYTLNLSSHTGVLIDLSDNITYRTIEIGSQTWFAENLNYETTDSWQYQNSSANGDVYGRLYTWDAALTACPSGWHLPTDDEWKQLEISLGMNQSEADAYSWRGTDQGKQMKSTSGWYSNGSGTNSSGFAALSGSYRDTNGSFYGKGYYGYWWLSNENSSTSSLHRALHYDKDGVFRSIGSKAYGFSVRCLKD